MVSEKTKKKNTLNSTLRVFWIRIFRFLSIHFLGSRVPRPQPRRLCILPSLSLRSTCERRWHLRVLLRLHLHRTCEPDLKDPSQPQGIAHLVRHFLCNLNS